jgi:DnaJ like chaperone protein
MYIFGKIFGAVFGALIYGPIGFIIGIGVGHLFDKGLELNMQAQGPDITLAKKVFFKTTFTVMGYIAKVDGRVSEKEIQVAREAMAHLQLSPEQKMSAIQYFNFGKSPQFNFSQAMDNFSKNCGHHPQLVQLFVEMQIQAALVDGIQNRLKRQVLEMLCDKLNLPRSLLSQMESHYYHEQPQSRRYTPPPAPIDELADAYKFLGVTASATNQQIKKAYRQLMSQNHPDKLVSKGLPNEMIKLATEKTQRIQKAYELINQSRGIK